MLFLGCSLTYDETVKVVQESASPGAVHFALIPCDQDSRDRRIRQLAKLRIRAIVYETGKHESVRVVLEELLARRTAGSTAPILPVTTTSAPPSTKPSLSKLVARINARLVRQRKGHPSFRLMNDDPARELLPRGEQQPEGAPIPNANRRVVPEKGEPMSFSEFFRQSWGKGEQNHLFIVGQGGVGKTVALLTFATEENFLPKGVPSVYIPLYDLAQYAKDGRDCMDDYLQSCFAPE
jgi:hypothetical protein